MSDWWSKKLTGQQPSPQRPYSTPPTTPPIRIPAPVQAPHAPTPAYPQQNGRQDVLDPSRAPTEQITMGEALRLWQGGEAMRKEGDLTCPDCGSIYVFSRTGKGHSTTVNGASPAPRCYECGWNGMYGQGNWS
jgi:hypothetical protein